MSQSFQEIKTDSILPASPIGISSQTGLEWKNENKCFICKQKFCLGKRHHCRYCGNSVCSKHSMKVTKGESLEKTRICDLCDAELIRQEIRGEIQEELAKLQDSINIAKESFEKVEAERSAKNEISKKLEEELMVTERKQKAKEEILLKRLNEEVTRGSKASEMVDGIKKELDLTHEAESEINAKRLENEEKIEELSDEILKLKEKKIELLAQLEHLSSKLKGSLPLEQVIHLLCEKCKGRAASEYRSRTSHSGPSED